ncbi:MAG: PIN domain-containing protein [Acidobacteriota bacterium]|nr:PIN domain-containing protein [Acidobacteriota bacterium]
MAVLVDAGPLYAYVDADDDHHMESLELLESHPGPLVVPILVVTEVAYLLARRLGAEAEVRFLGDFAAGNLISEAVAGEDWLRIAELVGRYRDLPLGTVDASVVAAAERLQLSQIATLDRRHFAVVRPSHIPAFELLP